jgi:MoaA/NifB/PqqE/SkfB family radical SAM enzyme
MRCGHCFYWNSLNNKSVDLRIEDIGKIADSLTQPISLSLTGGEPFLRKDLGKIVRCFIAKRKAREIAIATNGFFTEEIREFCNKFIIDFPHLPLSVQVSMDGLKKTHDDIRGCPGAFNHALYTIKELYQLASKHEHFSVSAGIAVQKRNLAEMPALLEIIGSTGAAIRINLIRGESSGTFGVGKETSSHIDPKDGHSIFLNIDEMHGLHDLLISKNVVYGFWSKRHQRIFEIGMHILEQMKKQIECYAGIIDGVIYSNGDVAFCELTKPIGNLYDFDFDMKALWQSTASNAMRDKITKCFCIHGCNLSTSLMFEPEFVKEAVLG